MTERTETATWTETMSQANTAQPGTERTHSEGTIFLKETLVSGQPAEIECLDLNRQSYVRSGRFLKTVQLEDEWFEDVSDPESAIRKLKQSGTKADLFTFWQRLPETEPKYGYYREPVNWAVMKVDTYEDWWSNTIRSNIRTIIRKAGKNGVEVHEVPFNDEFVRGMTEIFNETPVRQGRPFFHYGKDFDTVKQQFSRFIFREEMIGAYFEGKLIGFIMLAIADQYARVMQIISFQKHRNKNTNNAMLAKAVEVCARKNLPYLVYEFWTDDSLSAFKHHCGFRKTPLPRYYVPLTLKGKLALRLGLHKGIKERLPNRIAEPLKNLRRSWMLKKAGG